MIIFLLKSKDGHIFKQQQLYFLTITFLNNNGNIFQRSLQRPNLTIFFSQNFILLLINMSSNSVINMILKDSDSDDELEMLTLVFNVRRSRSCGSTGISTQFVQGRFRMNRSLFLHILSYVEGYKPYFIKKINVVGVIDLFFL